MENAIELMGSHKPRDVNPLDFSEKMSMKSLGAVWSPRTETNVEARFVLYCLLVLLGACTEEITVSYAPRKLHWFWLLLPPRHFWERIFVCFYFCLAHPTH